MKANEKKVGLVKDAVIKACGCAAGCPKCAKELQFVAKMSDACIPLLYWDLRMSDFRGAPQIKKATEKYIEELSSNFAAGTNVCFSGTLGTGKTYSMTNILKAALTKNYSCLYITLSEMVSLLTGPSTRHTSFETMAGVDFLAVDEVDSRHIAQSDAAQDFYGAAFERVLRSRIQNRLPILMATNNASLDEAFSRQFQKTIESLSANCIVVAALGKDFRMAQ